MSQWFQLYRNTLFTLVNIKLQWFKERFYLINDHMIGKIIMKNRNTYLIVFIAFLTTQSCFSMNYFCYSSISNLEDYGLTNLGKKELIIKKNNKEKIKYKVFGRHESELDINFLGSISFSLGSTKLFITTSTDGETKIWEMTNKNNLQWKEIQQTVKLKQTVKIKRPNGWENKKKRSYAWEKNEKEKLPKLALFFYIQSKNKKLKDIKQLIDLEKGKLISEIELID